MERYLRNQPIISKEKQKELKNKTIMIVGLGGLGGPLAMGAARLGVGRIVLVDGGRFKVSNLNRQLFSSEKNIGQLKVEIVKQGLLEINPNLKIEAYPMHIDAETDVGLTESVDLILDGLDSMQARYYLQRLSMLANIPIVHGALGNWDGQVALLMPDLPRMEQIYPDLSPSVIPSANLVILTMYVASLQLLYMLQYFLDVDTVEKNILRRFNLFDREEVCVDFN